jgi:hypothetical protein
MPPYYKIGQICLATKSMLVVCLSWLMQPERISLHARTYPQMSSMPMRL